MASGGQSARNRPALYQPTDFGSQQKRLSSSGEQKKEVETVTFKIQQRRLFGGDEKPSIMENKVKILKGGAEKKCNAKNSEEAPGGVAPKDLEKINKLKEYMAKIGDKAPNSGSSISKSVEPTTFGKDTVTSVGKADGSPVKPSAALVTKTGMLYAKGPVVTGKSPVMTGKGGLLGVGKFSGEFGKPIAKQSKESKERDAMKEDKGSKDSKLPRDGKESRNNKGGRNSRNQKNVNKAAVRNKGNQNEKSNKISKNAELNQSGKPLSKTPVTSASISNGGTRPKIVTSKGLVNNQRLPNDSHKSQNRPFDRAQNHSSVNSYYSQANNVSGYHSNDHSQWLAAQYAMSGLQLNNQSILGQPQGRPIDYQKSVTATQDKNSDPKVGVNRAAAQKKPVTTVVATKDKSEQKKSLDFVKSFFDNDPEVQYHRKLNAETRNSVKVPASTPALPVPPKEEPVNRLHVSSHVNSHINSHVNSQQSFVHHNTHIPGTHISGSMATTYSSVYHNSNMGPNNLHPNPPSGHFHSNSAATALHLGATPNQLHGAISSHPSSMQHAPGFDLYSQVNQMNPMLSASNFHGTVTNYPGGISHNTGSMNPTLPSYGSYFPDGSHMSHVHHIQQQIDPNVITDMLQSNSKNWQEKALTKCGPIDSNQARSLIEQLIDGTYECMVCCESVKWNHQVWSCSNCYHVFHLTCIRKWARSESAAVKEATCGLARASRHQA